MKEINCHGFLFQQQLDCEAQCYNLYHQNHRSPFRQTSITFRSANDSPETVREKPFWEPIYFQLQARCLPIPHVSRHVTSPLMAPPPGRDLDNLSSESSVVVFPAAWPGARGAAKTTWLRSVSTLYRISTLHSSLRAKSSRSFHADRETSLVPAASLPRPD